LDLRDAFQLNIEFSVDLATELPIPKVKRRKKSR